MTATDRSFIGKPVERIEDLRLLRGKGVFVDDLSLPGQLHAAIYRSSVAHGEIKSVDTSEARAMPGIHAVFVASDLGDEVPGIPARLFATPDMIKFYQPVLASKKVRFVGEPIAIVVADSPAIAEDALELIYVDIDSMQAVSGLDAERGEGPPLFDEHNSNQAYEYRMKRGALGNIFEMAPYTRRERLYVHRHTGITMETRGVLSRWDPLTGVLTSWGASKSPFANRKILAEMLRLDEEQVQMVEGDAGGSFGVRGEFFPEDFLIPFAARVLNRPVKWIEDRREHLLSITHARDIAADVELACDMDGTILGMRLTAYANMGAYFRTSTPVPPRNVGMFLPGPYRVQNYEATVKVLVSNTAPSGTYRGPGRFEADFFRERMFDLAATDLSICPVEFRRRNLLSEAELPCQMPEVTPEPAITALDSGAYADVLDRCLAKAGWQNKRALEGKLIDGRYHGLGMGCFVEGGAAGPAENARMVLEDDGLFSVYVGSSSVGQGVQTILTQIAAEAMEVPLESVRLFHGSTTIVKMGWGSYHSRSTVMGGNAVLLAAAEVKKQILTKAADLLQSDIAKLRYQEGVVFAEGGGSIDLSALAGSEISHEATFRNSKHTYTYGSHCAHIAVDPQTGRIEILDYVAIEDAGRIINPLTLHGQAVGSIVQGLGGALLEHFVYDDQGQMLTGSLADYLVPLATDFPNIRSSSIELRPSPFNPLGAKGAGEGGTIPVGGVLANAVASALRRFKVQPMELPLSPERVWKMIQRGLVTTEPKTRHQ